MLPVLWKEANNTPSAVNGVGQSIPGSQIRAPDAVGRQDGGGPLLAACVLAVWPEASQTELGAVRPAPPLTLRVVAAENVPDGNPLSQPLLTVLGEDREGLQCSTGGRQKQAILMPTCHGQHVYPTPALCQALPEGAAGFQPQSAHPQPGWEGTKGTPGQGGYLENRAFTGHIFQAY